MLYVLKNLHTLKKIPVILNKTISPKVFAIADVANLTKEDYMRYTREQMELTDRYAILESAKAKGEEKGIEIGEEKIIRNLLASGKFNIGEVALYAGVSESLVQKVKNSLEQK
jgi:predicted transposase YdaD